TNNQADGNLFVALPDDFLGFFSGDSQQFVDLAAWRAAHQWDKNSAAANMQIDFDPDTLELTVSSSQPIPKMSVVNHIGSDILGQAAGETRAPGPL
ncbi:MAG: transcriptional initiation protein Tat, partial [Acidobacteriota bacterium]